MTKANPHSRVAVLGASPKEDRFSFKAVKMLTEHGHTAIPVHPAGHSVFNIPGVKTLDDVSDSIDTLTMYVNADISDKEVDRILRLNPRRVIFNPGSENAKLADQLRSAGIEVLEECTLVMLRTGQF